MPRRVFFSFHYAGDIHRVNQIRNTWLLNRSGPAFEDGSLREPAATRDPRRLKQLIDRALNQTCVTAVLIGAETAERLYVNYEIRRSLERGNGLVGVYIHQLPGADGRCAKKGPNPLDRLWVPGTGRRLSAIFETYDWVEDDGGANLDRWIEEAARRALVGGTGREMMRAEVAERARAADPTTTACR